MQTSSKRIKRTDDRRLSHRSERGASAVEFAIVVPVFLLFLVGIIQYGTIFLVRNQMTQAASDAARVAVTSSTMSAAETAAATALAQDLQHDGVGLMSAGCSNSAVSCTAVPATSCSAPAGYECLQVTITYDYSKDPVIAIPLLPTPTTITASSTVLVGNGNLQ